MLTGRVIGFCSNFPVHSRSKQDKAHRRKQGAGVVPYVKPLPLSNAAFLYNFVDREKLREARRTGKPSAGVVPYVKPLSRSNAAFGNLSQVELLVIFALLISNSAGSLASRLARGLALATATVLSGLAKILGFNSLNTLHSIYPPINIDLLLHYITNFHISQGVKEKSSQNFDILMHNNFLL